MKMVAEARAWADELAAVPADQRSQVRALQSQLRLLAEEAGRLR